MLHTYTHHISLSHIPPGLKRGALALIAPFDQNNNLILANKKIYPNNIYRFIGGGIDDTDDTPQHAAQREFQEEVCLNYPLNKFIHHSTHQFDLTETSSGTHYDISIDLFTTIVNTNTLKPASDITVIKPFDRFEFKQLINRINQLPQEIVTLKPGHVFSWYDWGNIYNQINLSLYRHWPNSTK